LLTLCPRTLLIAPGAASLRTSHRNAISLNLFVFSESQVPALRSQLSASACAAVFLRRTLPDFVISAAMCAASSPAACVDLCHCVKNSAAERSSRLHSFLRSKTEAAHPSKSYVLLLTQLLTSCSLNDHFSIYADLMTIFRSTPILWYLGANCVLLAASG
jgi:hypothetical protein